MEDDKPLNRKWKIWEMWDQNKANSLNFMDNMQQIGEFDTIFTFWQHWNYYPHADPSELFENPITRQKIIIDNLNHSIEAIGIFEENVKPGWEDPANCNGCDLCIRKPKWCFNSLKELWENLVLSVIGENLPYCNEITGCRIVDKKEIYKFELWLKSDISYSNDEKSIKIKSEFAKIFGDGIPKIYSHKNI